MPETFSARLVQARLVTPRVRALRFERVDGRPFTFVPGQWVSLVLPLLDGQQRPVRRSYSLASLPAPSPGFELVVTAVEGGAGSGWLHQAAPGVVLEVKGPQGTFAHTAPFAPSLFVATGTGIAPFRGMVHAALAAGHRHPLWVLFGIRTLADGLYLDELRALAAAHPWLRVEVVLSRPEPGWPGLTGYVQAHVRRLFEALALEGEAHAYVCGVKKMLTAVQAVLRTELGLPRQRVHLESYD
jgi:CDP-4-dehydro-6-deoxyglucose reductase, E3